MPHEVAYAAKLLQDQGVDLVEYGQQLKFRFGNRVPLTTVDWAVSEEQIIRASKALCKHGFPRAAPSEALIPTNGEWETTGFIHNIVFNGAPTKVRIRLYPLSFVGFSLQDTVLVSSTFHQMCLVLTPKPWAYMLSLIQYLLRSPPFGDDRNRAVLDLRGFITYFIFREQLGWNSRRNVEEAVSRVRSWDWGVTELKYLGLVERIVRDRRFIRSLSCYLVPNPVLA